MSPQLESLRFPKAVRGIRLIPARSISPAREPVEPTEPSEDSYVKLEALLLRIQGTMDNFVQQQQTQVSEIEKVVTELTMALTERLVGHSIKAGVFDFQPLLESAVAQFDASDRVIIHVSTTDHAQLKKANINLDMLGSHVELRADGRVPVGACIAEAGGKMLATTLEDRLAAAKQAIMEGFSVDRR